MIVDLNLIGKRVLVVGGGTEAVRKVEGLLTQDCEIIVITDQVADEIRSWANAEKLKLEEELVNDGAFLKRFEPLFLVMAATDDKELNRSIVKSADAMRCYAYTVDDTEYSDFSCPAVVNLHDTGFALQEFKTCVSSILDERAAQVTLFFTPAIMLAFISNVYAFFYHVQTFGCSTSLSVLCFCAFGGSRMRGQRREKREARRGRIEERQKRKRERREERNHVRRENSERRAEPV